MVEKEIEIEVNKNNLSSTICLPENSGQFPTILMVNGSGPLDRNENIKGQKLDIFNTIAHFIANKGIASLRYDKRGCGKSTGDYYKSGHYDFVSDAQKLIEYLKHSDFCNKDQIYALGHSEGSIIIPQLFINDPSYIAGLVLLCPFIKKMEDIMIKQAHHFKKSINELKGITGIISRIFYQFNDPVSSNVKLIESLRNKQIPMNRIKIGMIGVKWLQEIFHLNPPDIFKKVTCPMLVIGGEKDVQCDPQDVRHIENIVKTNVEAHIIPNLTHILRFDKGDHTIFRCKELIKKPLENIIMELISEWFKKQIAQKQRKADLNI